MKRIFICIAALLASVAISLAQTPEEIIGRMDSEMKKADEQGLAITMDIAIPIIGKTSAAMRIRGEKSRTEMSLKDFKETLWMDESTMWTYSSKDNEVVIENRSADSKNSSDDNIEMFSGITEGYDVTLEKETADTWQFRCDKSKSNTNKDDPKKMTLIVSKKDYMPKSLSTKLKGVTVTMRDAKLGVSESEVTFNPASLPGVTITDKR
jgi:outer membrane lipoprotein-sorting protein